MKWILLPFSRHICALTFTVNSFLSGTNDIPFPGIINQVKGEYSQTMEGGHL
jgi:hypothetical protein